MGVEIPFQKSKRIPIQEPRGQSEEPGLARPARDAFTAKQPPAFRIDANARTMRRGIILMTILEPCRGAKPFMWQEENSL